MFWVSTMGWLFWHDLWPSWRPGEPPPFHIDDVAEVQKGNNQVRTFWAIERGKVREAHLDKVFRASTWLVHHKEEDTFSLHARLDAMKGLLANSHLDAAKDPLPQEFYVGNTFKIDAMTSEYRVTRAGRLHSLQAEVKATLHSDRLMGGKLFPLLHQILRTPPAKRQENSRFSEPVSLKVWGEVRDDQFFAHCRATVESLSKPMEFDLPPATVSYTGSVLMPLHPVNKISGLRPGQHWRLPLVDPLRDAFASLSGFSSGVRSLNANVLPQPEMLKWGDSETSCLVIEYTNDENNTMGRTWVEQSSNRVLQQEAILEDDRWIMKRDPPHGISKSLLGQ
jgi:hypothetical protein